MSENKKRETLEEFKNRVYGFESNSIYLNDFGSFNTAGGLCKKVDENGKMKKFIGNTTVFLLNDNNGFKDRVIYFQQVLYTMCHRMLSEKLRENTLHMTLHDLMNGLPEEVSQEDMKKLGDKIQNILSDLRKKPFKINLQSTWAFNMVNTSIVLGLKPCTQRDWDILTDIYRKVDEVYSLSYPFTPHVTLAYFKPGSYSGSEVEKLRYTIECLSEEKLSVTFTEKDLVYQIFEDMNSYY